MTLSPGLLNHGEATSRPPTPRGRGPDPSSLEPADTRPLRREPPCPRPPGTGVVGWRLHAGPGWVASPRFRPVGLLLLLSFQPRADLARVSSPAGSLAFPAAGLERFGSPGQSSIPTTSGWDEGGWEVQPSPVVVIFLQSLLLLLSLLFLLPCTFFKGVGMSHSAGGGDVGTGQGPSRAGALCAEARGAGWQ